MTLETAHHPLDRQVRLMFQAAMLIFVWTIGIGILNGLDLVEFTHTQLLSHLHGGTLGWMTLGILAVTLWLFGASNVSEREHQVARIAGIVAVVAIAGYVFAFATTTGVTRPIAGTLTLASLVVFALWTLKRIPHVTLTVPRLFVIVGLLTSVLGGAFGVINGFAIARGWDWVPDSFFDAHPGTMEVGFVIPVAMGLAEWGLRRREPEQRASKAGLVQVALMFIAFVIVLVATLTETDDLIGAGTGVAVIAVVVFFVRMFRIAMRTSLLERTPERHSLVGGLLIGVTIVYITVVIQMAEGDFDAIPRGQLLSFIHLLAVGGTTNALLGMVVYLSRRATPPAILDDIVFWGIVVGVSGFVIALSSGVDALIKVFVPVMGVALLVAIVVHLVGLTKSAPAVAETSSV